MATRYSSFIPGVTNGLVLYLDAAKRESYPGSGTSWYDLSGNGHVATLANGPTHNGFSKSSEIYTDPTDGFVYLDDFFHLNYVTVAVMYTRESNDGVSDRIIYNKENVWELRDVNGHLQWALQTNNRGWYWSDTGYDVAIGETIISHLTYNGNEVKAYVNGTLVETDTDYPDGGVLNQQNTYPKLNSRGSGQTSWTNGGDHSFSVFKVFNRALSQEEVTLEYNALKGRFGL